MGVFDDLSDGLRVAITAHLYDRDNPSVPLRTVVFAAGDAEATSGTLVGGSRFLPIAPLDLEPGFHGTIVAENYQSLERHGNNFGSAPLGTTNNPGNLISFVGASRYGTKGAFPTNIDNGPANRFAAGTFVYEGRADARNVNVTFSLGSAPSGATINATTGEIQWTPTLAEPVGVFNVTALDASGLSDTTSFAIVATPTPAAPGLPPLVGDQAVHFDGIDDYVEIQNSPSLSPARQLTLTGWFEIDEFPGTYQNLFHKGNLPNCGLTSCSNREYALFVQDNGRVLFSATPTSRVGVGERVVSSAAGLVKPGQWYHFAAVINADEQYMAIYVNGINVAQGFFESDGISQQGGPLRFVYEGHHLRGSIEEYRLYDVAFSAAEIRADMHTALNLAALPTNLQGYWRFDEASGTAIIDDSGNANHGVLINSNIEQGIAGPLGDDPDTAYEFSRGSNAGGAIALDLPQINTTSNEFNTVSFWMHWDGTENSMPFGMTTYDLWFQSGFFGFNTGVSDLFGMSSAGLANRWVHVTAAFNNGPGTLNKLWIDGVPQLLSQRFGVTTARSATQNARISGWTNDSGYRFTGSLDEFAVFNRELTDAEVADQFLARNNNYVATVAAATPIAYYRLGESLDGIAYDLTANANHGVVLYPSRTTSTAPLFNSSAVATFTVTNTADAGPGTLRQALTDALDTPGSFPVNIEFNIPATDPNFVGTSGEQTATIRLVSPLPKLNRSQVTIDGRSQTLFGGDTNIYGPEIVIDGSQAGTANGIEIIGDANRIVDLNIHSFDGHGIWINGGDDNVIEGSYLGTDATGSTSQGNALNGILISVSALRNRVGTDGDGSQDDSERNVISGNGLYGIEISGTGTNYNVIAGNYVGTDALGGYALQNGIDGVRVVSGAEFNRIGTDGSDNGFDENERNVISGNTQRGVRIENAHRNIVAGNYIGTDVAGTYSIPNLVHGVLLSAAASNNLVGTDGNGIADALEGNLLSGNVGYGIRIRDTDTSFNAVAGNYIGLNSAGTGLVGNTSHGVYISDNASYNRVGTDGDGNGFDDAERNVVSGNLDGITIQGAHYNTVAGNFVGTDFTGEFALGNVLSGIAVYSDSSNNRIGTDGNGSADVFERNIIAAAGSFGIYMGHSGTTANTIQGNYIGTDVSGTKDFGVRNDGILLFGGATNNLIGGSGALANLIVHSHLNGINVSDAGTLGNPIRSNQIYANHGLAIDIGNNGVSLNDQSDADAGPADFLNFPVLTSAVLTATDLIVSGFARTGSEIDFFIAALDPQGFGEGLTYLVSKTEGVDDADGSTGSYVDARLGSDTTSRFTFTIPRSGLSTAIVDGLPLTATATLGGNTSEFSRTVNIKASGNSAPVLNTLSIPGSGNEGAVVELRGSYADLDSADGHVVTVDWGDGTITTLEQRGPTVNTSEFFEYNGRRYTLLTTSLSFLDAEAQAQRLGGHLATINDAAENGFLAQWVNEFYGYNQTVHIGIYDAREEGVMEWTSGEPVTYTSWGGGQPDNWSGVTGEDFGQLNWSNQGLWNDARGGNLPALVELTDEKLFVASHIYADDGNYTVTVSVSDDDSSSVASTSSTSEVAIADVAPTLTFLGDATLDEGNTYTLRLTSSDPGNDTITSWTIDWGDGPAQIVPGNPASVTHFYADGNGLGRPITATATNEDGTFVARVLDNLLVSSSGNSGVLRFDTTGGGLIDAVIGGGILGAGQSVIGPDGKLYVSSLESGDVLRFDLQTGDFINTVVNAGEGGMQEPSGLAFAPNGNLLVASRFNNNVLRFDPQTGAFIDVFASAAGGLSGLDAILFAPNGNLLVSGSSSNSIARYDGITGNYLDTLIPAGTGGLSSILTMRIGPDGNLYVGTNANGGNILRFDSLNGNYLGQVISSGLVSVLPAGFAFAADNLLYVSDLGSQSVLKVDLDSGAVLGTLISAGTGNLATPGHVNLTAGNATALDLTVANLAPRLSTALTLSSNSIFENDTVNLIGAFIDEGVGDIHFVDITWGDGSMETYELPQGHRTFSFTHKYLDNPEVPSGDYAILVTLRDHDGAGINSSTVIHVSNEAPELLGLNLSQNAIVEGSDVTLTGSFSDVGSLDSHAVVVVWGDGATSPAVIDPLTRTFSAQHLYRDNNSDGNGYLDYTIEVTVDDLESGTDTASINLAVANADPVLVLAELSASEIDENETVTVTGTFTDLGAGDTHTVLVDWGDETSSTATITIDALSPVGGGTFTATHRYLNNAGETAADYVVRVVVEDDDEATATGPGLLLAVNNVLPSNLVLALDRPAALVDEGTPFRLSGTFVDPGTLDFHEVVIDWGDNTETRFGLEIGLRGFNDIEHIYPENRTEPYTITVRVNDDDEKNAPVVATLVVNVQNIEPMNLVVTTDDLDANITEGSSILLSGSFVDPGILDTHTVVINWGDATSNRVLTSADLVRAPGATTTTFANIAHTYLDDRPSGTSSDQYTITVTVTDDDFVGDLLVASRQDGRIARFDATTGAYIEDMVDGGTSLGAFAIGPDSNLYVINESTPSILRYNGTTGELMGEFVSPGNGLANPQTLAFGPGGSLYVGSGTNEVLRYDGATGYFVGRVVTDNLGTPNDETGGLSGPTGLAFGPNGRLLVSSSATNQVLRYDRITGEFLGALVADDLATSSFDETGGLVNPGALVISPSGNLIVASRDNNSILRYSATSGLWIDALVRDDVNTTPDETGGLVTPGGLSFAGGKLYVTSANNAILRFDGTTGSFESAFTAGGNLDHPGQLLFLQHQSSVRSVITVNNAAPVVDATNLQVRGLSPYITRERFISTTGATQVAPLQNLGLVDSYQTTDGKVNVTRGPQATELYIGGATDWSARLAGPEITTTGRSNLNFQLNELVYAFGFDFVEPEFDNNRGDDFVDSVFELQLFNGAAIVGTLQVERPNDTATFIGVQALNPFNRVELRETTGGTDREFLGNFYIGTTPGLAEGSIATLSGSFTDVSPDDTFTVRINWGDNSQPTLISKTANDRSFSAQHKYLDDIGPAGTPFDLNQITVTVEDDDLGISDPASVGLNVYNVKPLTTIQPGTDSTLSSIMLGADINDPGTESTEILTVSWSIDQILDDFNTVPPSSTSVNLVSGSGPNIAFTPVAGKIIATVTVSDDDLGSDTDIAAIISGTNADDRITVAADGMVTVESFDPILNDYQLVSTILINPLEADRILIFGLDGDDIIRGQASPLPLVADGGNGADVVTLSDGDDTAFLTSGDDIVDLGDGNNLAYLIPNSTLTVRAGGGSNTLNFSLADFGIALDMNQFDGTVQMVAADRFAFTATAIDNRFTAPGHNFRNGKSIRITEAATAPLPAGLVDGAVYEVSDVNGDTFRLKAMDGTIVDLTSNGPGNATLEHNVAVQGSFATLVGTAADDTITALAPEFDIASGVVRSGSNISTGDGNDSILSSGLSGKFDLGAGDNFFVQTLDTAELASIGGALDGADLASLTGSLDISVFGGTGKDTVIFGGLSGKFDLGGGDNDFVQTLDGSDLAALVGSLDTSTLSRAQAAFDGSELAQLVGSLDSADLASVFGSLDVSFVAGEGKDRVWTTGVGGNFDLGSGDDLFVRSLDSAALVELGGSLDSADLASLIGSLDVQVLAGSGADEVRTSLRGTFDLGDGADIFSATLDGLELASLGGALDASELAELTGLDPAKLAALRGTLDSSDLVALVGSLDVSVFAGAGNDFVTSSLAGTFDLGDGENTFIGSLDIAELALLGGALDSVDLAQLAGSLDTVDLVALSGALDGADLVQLVGSLDVNIIGGTGADQVRSSMHGTYQLGDGDNLFVGLFDTLDLASLSGALDSVDLAALSGSLDTAELVSLGGALDSAELASLIGSLDVSVTLGSGNDQVESALRGTYDLGDGENIFIGNLDSVELAALGGALDGADLAAVVASLDSAELAELIGSLDSADLATTTGALDSSDLAVVIGSLDVSVIGGGQSDRVQSSLPGLYDLGGGDNLYIGTLDSLDLAALGGALDGVDLAYLIGALDGADLVQLGGALDGADLAALTGALDGAELAAIAGALDGAELVRLGGALDGAELAALIGSLDVTVLGRDGNDQVQSSLPGVFNLGAGNNSFFGTMDTADLVRLGGSLDGMELVQLIGSLDAADLVALGGALDGAELVALGGALDSSELAALIGSLDVDVTFGAGNDQVQSALSGTYHLGDGENLFVGTLDGADLAALSGALDSADLVALLGALDSAELAELIGSLDGADLATTTGALDGVDLASVLGALDVNVFAGNQADSIQSALPGLYDLGGGNNLFVGTLDSLDLAALGGALDGVDLAYLIGALDGADLVQLGGALDGADLVALQGALDGADLVALAGALDTAELVSLGGALDGAELATLIGALDVTVRGLDGNDRVQSKLPGSYELGDGNNSFLGTLDAAEFASLGGALDGMDLVQLIGSLDAAELAALIGPLDAAELVSLGGALDSAELAALLGSLDVSVTLGAGNDQVQSELRGIYDLGNGENLFIGTLDSVELAELGGALDSADLVALLGSLDSTELAAMIGSLDGADLASTTGALDGAELAALIGSLDVQVYGGNQGDQVQSALSGLYDLGGGSNLFVGTLDSLELAALGGALDGTDLAYLIGALDGADLVQLGGALDGLDLAALQGALDGADLAALTGTLDGADLVRLGGALDGAELAELIGSLDVDVRTLNGHDRVRSAVPGTYNLGNGNNSFLGTLDTADLVSLGGSLDGIELVQLIGSLDAAELAALIGSLDGAELVSLGGALDSTDLAALIGALDVNVTLGAGNDQVQSALRGTYQLGDGDNLFLGTLDSSDLAQLGGALDSADLVALLGSLDSLGLAALIGSLDNSLVSLDISSTTGVLDGVDLASLIGSLDVQVFGGAAVDQVQSSLPGLYDLGGGNNLFIGNLDGLELAELGGALDGVDLAYLIGALDGADLVQLGGSLDGIDLAALHGALDGADLASISGSLDGFELVSLGGALDGAELVALIGALDVEVRGLDGNDEVRSKLPGIYNLGHGNNSYWGIRDTAELASLGGALDGLELVRLIGALDAVDLAALTGALDVAELAALGGALDSAELAELIGALDVSVTLGSQDDQVQTVLAGSYNLGDGLNRFSGILDTAELAELGGALDGADLVALLGALDGLELASLIGSLDAGLSGLTGALDGVDLAAVIGALDAQVVGGHQEDRIQSSLPGSYNLGAGENLFIGLLDAQGLAGLGGALDAADLAYVIGALDGADLAQLAGALDGARVSALDTALQSNLSALAGALDAAELVHLGGALDGTELAALIGALDVAVTGLDGIDRVQTSYPGTYTLGDGENTFVGNFDSLGLATVAGALDSLDLVQLLGSLDAAEFAALGLPRLSALGGALDGSELVSLLETFNVTVATGSSNDIIQSDLPGSYDLGEGTNRFFGTMAGAQLAALGGVLDAADLVAIIGSLDGTELTELLTTMGDVDLSALAGALDSDELLDALRGLDVQVLGGDGRDEVQSSWGGAFDLGSGDNLFIGTFDGLELAALGGALDSVQLAELVGALDGAELVSLGGALDGADLVALIGSLDIDLQLGAGDDDVRTTRPGNYQLGDGANLFLGQLAGSALASLGGALDSLDLVPLIGALDNLELAQLGGALDRHELVSIVNSLSVVVEGGQDADRVFTDLSGTFNLSAGNDLLIASLDGPELAELVGALDSTALVELVGSLDTSELLALSGALDQADLVQIIGALDSDVDGGPGADRVESAFSGSFDLGDGNDVFAGRVGHYELLSLRDVLPSSQLTTILQALQMDVVTGAGNDFARWGLSGTYDMGAGSDAVSTIVDGEMQAALRGVLDASSLANLLGSLVITADTGDGDDFIESGVSGFYQAGLGKDRFVVGSQTPIVPGVTPQVTLDGSLDSDVYTFTGTNVGHVVLTEPAESGTDNSRDLLDFAGLKSAAGITLDLELTSPQQLVPGTFTLTLSDALGIEDVIGTPGADVIRGNERPNILHGASQRAHAQPTTTSVTNPVTNSSPQLVFLDFDSDQDPGEHVYTTEERNSIQAVVAANFWGPDAANPWFNFTFTQTEPTTGEFTRLVFNRTAEEVGGPGGLAGELDFRNLNRSSFAYIQVNGILGAVGQPADTPQNWITLSAKIATHEMAHTLGLQHQDSFGPIGFGIHNPPGPDGYLPPYPGPVAAFETFNHLMSSPASVGSNRFSDLNGLFFSERSAIKLAFNERGMVVEEDVAAPHDIVTVEGVARNVQSLGELPGLDVPNTLRTGIHSGLDFDVAAIDVVGSLTEIGQRDFYSFSGRAGDLINIEVMSYSLTRHDDNNIDPVIRLYDANGNLLTYYVNDNFAFSDDKFEPPDPTILDFFLPADGNYIVEVAAFTLIGTPRFDELCGPTGPREGSQACTGDVGAYEALIYRFDTYNRIDLGDELYGRGGADQLYGGLGYDVLKGGDGADLVDAGPLADGDSAALTVLVGDDVGFDTISRFYEGSQLLRGGSFIDAAGDDWTSATVNYGDGSGEQPLALDKLSKTFELNHFFGDDGEYEVTVTITNDDGIVGSASFEVLVTNVAPILTVLGSQTVSAGATLNLTNIGSLADPGYGTETFNYSVNWGEGNSSSGSAKIDQNGGPNLLTRASFDAIHTYTQPGQYQITVTATDDNGGTTSKTIDVTVNPASQILVCRPAEGGVGANVFAVCNGEITEAGQTLTFDLDTSSYTVPRGYAILGFHVEATGGSSLDPAAVQLSADTTLTTVMQNPNLTAFPGSVHLARVGRGNLSITVGGEGGTTGTFQVNVYLAADTNGSKTINAQDISAVRGALGSTIGQLKYVQAADANLDGIISSFDYAQVAIGNGTVVVAPPSDGGLAGEGEAPIDLDTDQLPTPSDLDPITAAAFGYLGEIGLNPSEQHRLNPATAQVGAVGAVDYGWFIGVDSGQAAPIEQMDVVTAARQETSQVLEHENHDSRVTGLATRLAFPQAFPASAPRLGPTNNQTTAQRVEALENTALAAPVRQTTSVKRVEVQPIAEPAPRLRSKAAELDQLYADLDLDDLFSIDIDSLAKNWRIP
ncbi:MAG: PKD domain-containing protein [Pirellulaceae bacterium]